MMRRLLLFGLLPLAAAAANAEQSANGGPQAAFTSASITPSAPASGRPAALRIQPRGGFSARNATLRELIEYAYQRHPADRREVTSGPAWLDSDRFDVVATAASEHEIDADGSLRRTWAMVRALLAERFKLQVRERSAERAVYALTPARADGSLGPKLRRTDVDCSLLLKAPPTPRAGQGPPCGMKTPPGRLFANTVSLATLASLLSRHLDRVVIDRTGLSGRFDVELEAAEIKAAPDYKPGPSDLALPPAKGASIFVAVREQLGLKLEPQRAAVPVVVIDRAEKPTPD